MPKEDQDLVVGLDIGTAKIMVVVAEVLPDGELRIAGLGSAPTHGLKRGVVVNIDATVQSIQAALKEAEMMADCKITNSCGSTSSRRWSFGILIAFAVSTTRATSTGVTSLSRTITMPVLFWPRMWLPVMPV